MIRVCDRQEMIAFCSWLAIDLGGRVDLSILMPILTEEKNWKESGSRGHVQRAACISMCGVERNVSVS